MYSWRNLSRFDYSEWGVGNVSMMDIYLQNIHHKEDMIVK